MSITSIKMYWDDDSGDDGWFVRLRRDDGQERDEACAGEGSRDREIDYETAMDLGRGAVAGGLDMLGQTCPDDTVTAWLSDSLVAYDITYL